jgi:uncharacterized protein YukE
MSAALAAVKAIYENSQQKLNIMLAACRPDQVAQHDEIVRQYLQALENYQACINQIFHENDPALVALENKANACADQIKHIESQLGDIAKVVNIITQGAQYGSKIVGAIVGG